MAKGKMKAIDMISWILCTIAAINLGIIGVSGYNVLGLFGGALQIVHIIIGVAGLYSASWYFFNKK